jgi:hypothetical protein
MANPIIGAKTRPKNTFLQPAQIKTFVPAVATPAPAKPDISPWLSLVGRPKTVAKELQMITEMSAVATVRRFMESEATKPFPMVTATAVPEKAPTRLNNAAIRTAVRGDKTRVETTVAMELQASVQPFTKSKATDKKRIKIKNQKDSNIYCFLEIQRTAKQLEASQGSGTFHYNAFNNISNIFAVIRSGLQTPIDFLPFDGNSPVRLPIQKLPHHLLGNLVSFIFQAINFYTELVQVIKMIQIGDGFLNLFHCLINDVN